LRYRFLLCSLIGFVAFAALAADDFEAREYKDAAGKVLPYRLLKPLNYDAQKKYPLVFFMHGAGERGKDNKNQLKHVVMAFAKPENREKFPCFVIAPQCPGDKKWCEVPWDGDAHTMPAQPSEPMRLAMEAIAGLQKEFGIDGKRLYAMGLSMGGFGTWDALSRYPDQFAAGVPMCGGADEAKAAVLAQIPAWDFHGGNDGVVKTKRSRNITEAIKKAGGEPKYTEYPGVGHDCWSKAIAEPELLPWLFAQVKK
jgi:predicted peptidase